MLLGNLPSVEPGDVLGHENSAILNGCRGWTVCYNLANFLRRIDTLDSIVIKSKTCG